jgi:cupin 2 domain-containing protein
MSDFPIGRYRHYKGNEYTALGVARHSETLEELVVYRPEYGEQGLWVRPKQMFLESVELDGQRVPRFQPIKVELQKSPMNAGNLLANIPAALPNEVFETILNKPNWRVERIVSQGQSSPDGFWFDQETSEFVVLLQGAARLRFEDEAIEMQPGSFINIAAHRRHRVEWTDPRQTTIWLAIHYRDGE